MAEGGELQLGHSGSDEDRGLQELEKELEEIREEIQVARKKQDRQQTLRRQIKEAKKELAAITGDTRDLETDDEPQCFSRFDYDFKLLQIFKNLEASTTKLQNDIQEIKRATRGVNPTIAFMAQLSKNVVAPCTDDIHQPIVFDKIETNIGNAYSQFTGVFTAPLDGVYQFNLEVSIPNGAVGNVLHIIIEKNGVRAGYTFFVVDSSLWVRKTTSVTIHLLHRDTVQSVIVQSSGTGNNVIAGAVFHTHFSGFLIGLTEDLE